jgi:hypothetical protein
LQIEVVRATVDKVKTVYAHLQPNLSLRNQQSDRNVLRVTLRGGFKYAVDVTSIQNGFHETVLPWAKYMSQRSSTGKEVCTWPDVQSVPRCPDSFGRAKPMNQVSKSLTQKTCEWMTAGQILLNIPSLSATAFCSETTKLDALLNATIPGILAEIENLGIYRHYLETDTPFPWPLVTFTSDKIEARYMTKIWFTPQEWEACQDHGKPNDTKLIKLWNVKQRRAGPVPKSITNRRCETELFTF